MDSPRNSNIVVTTLLTIMAGTCLGCDMAGREPSQVAMRDSEFPASAELSLKIPGVEGDDFMAAGAIDITADASARRDPSASGQENRLSGQGPCQPSDLSMSFAEKGENKITKCWIGVHCDSASRALLDQLNLSCGLVVHEVVEGGPSDKKLQVCDVIYQLDGQPLSCKNKLCKEIAIREGQSIQLTVYRKGQPLQVEVFPQKIEYLDNQRILEFTVANDNSGHEQWLTLPHPDPRSPRDYRLFVIHPSLQLDGQSDNISAAKETAAAESGLTDDCGRVLMEKIVSFRVNEDGQRVLVVREAGRVTEFVGDEIKNACEELQKLDRMIQQ